MPPSQAAYPAYQHLPYTGQGLSISVTGFTPTGQIVLEVFSQVLTVDQERAVYNAFLQGYHDPGTKYIVHYSSIVVK